MQFINRKILWIGGIGVVILFVVGGFYAKSVFSGKDKGEVLGIAQTAETASILVETVGGDLALEESDLGMSWPGEIVSLADIEVQPQREGTIVEWKVNIGQKVSKGQVLGKLSAPPATPELTGMLAEKAESLAKAKNQTQAFATFAEKNKQQLKVLQETLDKNEVQGGGSKSIAAIRILLKQAKIVAEAKRSKARISIEQGIVNTFSKVTNSSTDPLVMYKKNSSYLPIYFRNSVGISNLTSRDKYTETLSKLLVELRDADALPQNAARAHFQAALNVVSASFAGDEVTMEDIKELREAVIEAQSEVAEALEEYEDALLEVANMEKELVMAEIEYAEKNKEIAEKISELEKEVELSQGEANAEASAYAVIAGALKGNSNIIAPQNGIVSAIYKKNGDFVSPGMPVAVVNAGNNKEHFVRFQIPSNLTIPEQGTEFTIIRPGFAKDVKKVKLIGIGTALGGNGSYVADAKFIDEVNWPVRVSVRVMPPQGLISNVSVPLAAVWWDESARANIWLVTEENRIRARQIKIGRTLGDKLEILEGLVKGDKYVAKNFPGLKTGQTIGDIKLEKTEQQNQETGDGHGHDE